MNLIKKKKSIDIREVDVWKTVFIAKLVLTRGNYQYMVMSCDLVNSLFQGLINDLLSKYLYGFLAVYTDEIDFVHP